MVPSENVANTATVPKAPSAVSVCTTLALAVKFALAEGATEAGTPDQVAPVNRYAPSDVMDTGGPETTVRGTPYVPTDTDTEPGDRPVAVLPVMDTTLALLDTKVTPGVHVKSSCGIDTSPEPPNVATSCS